MASNRQILLDLKIIMENDQKLELLTTYKGVPFVCKTKVTNVVGEVAWLKTVDPSLICLLKDHTAKVLGSDYFEPASANVIDVDLEQGLLELSDFSYIATKMGERMIVRVEPKEPLNVSLESTGIKIAALLADISISGMGIRVGYADYSAILKPGATLQISMELPVGPINLSGTVLSAVKTDEYYRLSLRFAQDSSQRSRIFKYLIDRRTEIEHEVLEEYEHCVKGAA